ncbi:hypothetical protein ACM01_32165 [Streptomyces viridochromogenes]|uniref:Secreted protein n=1 Tax=Streptomyces viridochromogenes TaxID=1938 RepID=A0A0J7Z480_STRVR|nr:hypothetical protein [Streptomyces viridochromogenes]KMS70352.1 hypothetical protein ACM01_32165 [Streptomyces viridochromogenes]KOG17108.1 hypothetical protein ADK35_24950 [Streptomyces viridochromogenes]KOG20129.1 hypothetical protein ADK36_17610 [Streptomyces viridochromogenes]
MRKKVTAISAIAAGIVLATGGTAAADGDTTTVKGGSGFSASPVVVNEPQQGIAVVNGALLDARCLAPWSNGAVLGGVAAPNSHYAACNTAKIDQAQNAGYHGGLLF